MAVISTQRRHTVKPSPGTGVNWAHPLANGLVAAWLFNEGGGFARPQSRIPLVAPSAVAGAQKWENIGGELGGYFDGSTVVSYGDVELVSGQAMSVVMAIRPDNVSQVAGVLNKRSATGTEAYSCGFSYASANTFIVQLGDVSTVGSPGTTYGCSASSWSLTRYQQITWTFDGTLGAAAKVRLWRDGVETTLTVGVPDAGGAIPNIADAIEFGRVNNGTLRYSGGIAYCYIFNTTLSPLDVQQLYLNPYAVLVPMRRRMWTVPAAATTTKFRKTLSALGTRTGSRQLQGS